MNPFNSHIIFPNTLPTGNSNQFNSNLKPFVMKTNIMKILCVIALVACFGKMNAQSDLLAINTVSKVSVPADITAMISEEKIKVSDFIQNPANNASLVRVNCNVPVTMQVKVFTMDGDMAKEETHTLNSGMNDLNVSLDNLAVGTYMVQFYSKEGSAVRRFIKMN